MKIRNEHILAPKISLGLKKFLLNLNLDLDRVKDDIRFNADYGWQFQHSISAGDPILTNIEVSVLYLEDRRFFKHNGFEFRSILRAIKRYVAYGSLNGMSTIDQQVIRISLKRYERTFSRKFCETVLAICLNFHVSKREIFDYYIHNAYLGHHMEGCEMAARKVFMIRAAELSKEQAAFIASLLPLPFPRAVWEAYTTRPIYPSNDPREIIALAKNIAPRWASRISFRMSVALEGYERSPKSL